MQANVAIIRMRFLLPCIAKSDFQPTLMLNVRSSSMSPLISSNLHRTCKAVVLMAVHILVCAGLQANGVS